MRDSYIRRPEIIRQEIEIFLTAERIDQGLASPAKVDDRRVEILALREDHKVTLVAHLQKKISNARHLTSAGLHSKAILQSTQVILSHHLSLFKDRRHPNTELMDVEELIISIDDASRQPLPQHIQENIFHDLYNALHYIMTPPCGGHIRHAAMGSTQKPLNCVEMPSGMATAKTTLTPDGQKMHYSVGAVIERNGLYLLIDRAKPPFGFAGIAGHVDEGESAEQAIIREVREESGLVVKRYSLVNCERPPR